MQQRLMSDMIRNQRPVTIAPEATVADACRRMYDRQVGAILVTDADDHLLGVFTGRDAVRLLAEGRPSDGPIRSVMTCGPCTMPPGCTAIETLRLMADGGVRHVPILDQDRVVGVVSWGDFRTSGHDRLATEVGLWSRCSDA